jgi:hypothetical protein
MIAAATAQIDGPDGWLGRAIGVQTLEARLDDFDCGPIRLPYSPVIEIVSLKYIDPDGVERPTAPDQYELLGASLFPGFNVSWPSPRRQREAVRIRYRAGYENLPAPIRAAILLMVGDLYRFRDTVTIAGNVAAEIPMSTTISNLLSPFRAFS